MDDLKDNEKKTLLKQFVKSCPKYIKGKKVQFPIIDDCLIQYSSLFPQQSTIKAKPVG